MERGPREWREATAPEAGVGAKVPGQTVDHLAADAEELANPAEAPSPSRFARDPPLPGELLEEKLFSWAAAGAQAGEILQRRFAEDASVAGDEVRGRMQPLRVEDGSAGARIEGCGRLRGRWVSDHEVMLEHRDPQNQDSRVVDRPREIRRTHAADV